MTQEQQQAGMSDERLGEIEKRAAKATPGPWHVAIIASLPVAAMWADNGDETVVLDTTESSLPAYACHMENIVFAAATRTDVPDLLAEVRRLGALLAVTEEFAEAYIAMTNAALAVNSAKTPSVLHDLDVARDHLKSARAAYRAMKDGA